MSITRPWSPAPACRVSADYDAESPATVYDSRSAYEWANARVEERFQRPEKMPVAPHPRTRSRIAGAKDR